MTIKPRLIVLEDRPRSGLGSVSWEQRRRMTAAELIELMGPLHVNHPQFQQRPRSLLPMPNLAGVQPCISRYDCGVFEPFKSFFRWMMT